MFRLACCQLAVTADKAANLASAVAAIRSAASDGARVVALPECFNSPYGTKYFADYAENIPGPSTQALGDLARELKLYIVGGSIPERDGDRLFNTATVFAPTGDMIAKHRKVHLFDIDVPGKIRFQESETLTAGSQLTTFDTEFGKMAVAICYDVRFPELSQLCTKAGAKMLFFPGAFNMTTGPLHWELLLRARAVDNQVYVAGTSPARDEQADYVAWGHSTVVSPWGAVLSAADAAPTTITADINLTEEGPIHEVRTAIPVWVQRRDDLYRVQSMEK